MPRSALLSRLASIARQHAKARAPALGIRLSRRGFLGAMGAVGATLAIPRRARAQGAPPRVAVIGAGISGLSAALALSDAGLADNMVVFESSNRIGGRMFSNMPSGGAGYWEDNQVTEWCGELIDSSFETIAALCTRYSLTLDDLPPTAPEGSAPVHYFDGAYYTVDQLNADFVPVVDALITDADSSIPELKANGSPNVDQTVLFDAITEDGRVLDDMSIYQWIETRVPGGHASKLGRLLDLAYASEYGADTTDQSALNLVLMLSGIPESGEFAAFGVSDERFHIRGGNQQLPLAIADDLRATVRSDVIQMNTSLKKIVQNENNTVSLTFDVLSGGQTTIQEVAVDAVILALPFAVLSQVVDISGAGFDDRKLRAIYEQGRGLCSKLQLQFTSRLWNTEGPWGLNNGEETFADTGSQCSWHVTRGQGGASGIMNGYTGGTATVLRAQIVPAAFGVADQGSAGSAITDMANEFKDQLDVVFPGVADLFNGKATLSLPHLDPNMRCSYAFWRVGQYQAFAGYERAPQGNVFFAGEHTSVLYQGFMEGGAAEGVRAAQEVQDAAAAGKLGAHVPVDAPPLPSEAPVAADSGCNATSVNTDSAGVVVPAALAAAAFAAVSVPRKAASSSEERG